MSTEKNMFFETIPLIFTLLAKSIKCSLVIDGSHHTGIYVKDYCPKMTFCPEGAHVMCMFYNPKSVMGPRCSNSLNLTMTPELATKLVDVSNLVRSKIARGKEKGKGGDFLPRGYGMFRLKWDTQLATFAQVLANQCVLRHDLCRATKKFPDPGQTAGLVRFSYPDWYPISKSGNFTTPGLNNDKLVYAVTHILKSWYGQKAEVTAHMITSYPDWAAKADTKGRLYLEMIYGPATHMGCGVSAYTEYAFYDNRAETNYNSVQIICNFSARPRKGTAVYNTVPPGDTHMSYDKCGCPEGSVEDDDCLCNEVPSFPENQKQNGRTCQKGMNCDPTVVLLPIFTVEDAPPEKLISAQRFANTTFHHRDPMRTYETMFENIDNEVLENTVYHPRNDNDHLDRKLDAQQRRLIPSTGRTMVVRSRYFDKRPNELKSEYEDGKRQKSSVHHLLLKKNSIFTRTPRFKLPKNRNIHTITSLRKHAEIKKDVVARKDFSSVKELTNKYLYGKKNVIVPKMRYKELNNYKTKTANILPERKTMKTPKNKKNKKPREGLSHYHEDIKFADILTTESVLNTAEQSVINNHKYINASQELNSVEIKGGAEENDRLMTLLDTLEQEVKHIELRDKEKKLFDTKIKEIYGKVVGKPVEFKTSEKFVEKINKRNEIQLNRIPTHNSKTSKTVKSKTERKYPDTAKYELDTELRKNFDERPRDYEYDISNKKYRNRNYLGESRLNKNLNNMNSYEQLRNSLLPRKYESNDEQNGKSSRDNFERNIFRNNIDFKRMNGVINHKVNNKHYYLNKDADDDPLSIERRRYYQDKLDNIERRLQTVQSYKRKKTNSGRHVRPMRPSQRESENQMDPLYMPERARYLHGY